MALDSDDVKTIAHLARIGLDEAERTALAAELNTVLVLVEELQGIDTTDVEPMAHPLDARLVLRDDVVTEDTDTLTRVDAMPLAYARSKCVAEHLLRGAAARGLAVTILRPSLICGHSGTGESSLDDLTAALIQSAARLGVAADTDWRLDQVPVDHVARVVATLPAT